MTKKKVARPRLTKLQMLKRKESERRFEDNAGPFVSWEHLNRMATWAEALRDAAGIDKELLRFCCVKDEKGRFVMEVFLLGERVPRRCFYLKDNFLLLVYRYVSGYLKRDIEDILARKYT
jgi:hypothetical protein